MRQETQLRAAMPEDADTLGRIHYEAWLETYAGLLDDCILAARSAQKSAAMFRDGGWRNVLIAFLNGEAVGFCGFGPGRDGETPEGEIYGLYLLKKAQRQGLGKALVQSAVHELRRMGFSTACLWVLKNNSPAIAFYEKQGFSPDGSREVTMCGLPVQERRFLMHIQE